MDHRTNDRLTGAVMFFARHWLAVLIVLTVLFCLPIVGCPLLMATNVPALQSLSQFVFHFYGEPVCHQLPDRSLYLCGYEMAVCARCFGIYFSFLAGCLIFALVRTRLKPWSIVYYVLLCVPMAIDGTAQLLHVAIPRAIGPGLQLVWMAESTNELRIITGAIFGLGSALYVLPYLQAIFSGDDLLEPAAVPPVASQGPAVK